MDGLKRLNELEAEAAQAEFLRCCGAKAWAWEMARLRPFREPALIFDAAKKAFEGLKREDWLEAFGAHPRIGDLKSLREKFASREQGAVASAPDKILEELASGNQEYERRFGHIFIVCAAGKSAEEMLAELKTRINNDPATELLLASIEQAKIAKIRLEKMINP